MATTHPLSLLGLTEADALYARVSARMTEVLQCPDEALSAPARRMVESSGKWARPIVVLATAKGLGDELGRTAVDAAICVELLHVGTLVHDDLMDAASSRRGTPTVNAVEGWKSSIIVGDFIMGRVGQLSASISAEVTAAISDAIVAVCIGQSLETQQLFDADRSLDDALSSVQHKTAELLASACQIGALVAGGDEETVRSLGAFGRAFGMQFQIVDDVLDIASDPELLGKPTGIDIATGVFSVPALLALKDSTVSGELRAALGSAREADDAGRALELVRQSTGPAEAIALAGRYADDALEALAPVVARYPAVEPLRNLPRLYTEWALEKHVAPEWQTLLRAAADRD